MSVPSVMIACPNLQDSLNNNFLTCDSANLFDSAPLFEFLNSPLNRSGYSQRVAPGQGKIRTIELMYEQRILESEVTQPGTTPDCTATTKRGNLATTCTIDPLDYLEVEELIEGADFTYICEDNQTVIDRKIMKMITALEAKAATIVTTQAIALIGGVSDDIAAGNKQTVGGKSFFKVATEKSDGSIDPRAVAKLNFLRMQSNYCAPAPVFGSDMYEYYQLMQSGCCSNEGLDVGALLAKYGTAVMYDRRVTAALNTLAGDGSGATLSFTALPGALQVVWYNANDGIGNAAGILQGTNYQKRVIYSPRTGMPIDLTLQDNCGSVSIIARANPKVCGLPSDLFAPNDHMNGVTYVNGIVITNP